MTQGSGAAVWVTRPAPENRRTGSALERAGHSVILVPVLEIVLVRATFPEEEPPDWIVFVSANAVRGMEFQDPRRLGECKSKTKVACVGSKTAEAARELGWKVALVPAVENARGLADALDPEAWVSRRVWVPEGSRGGSARTSVPEACRRVGATVLSFRVYETRPRSLPKEERDLLSRTSPWVLVVHSASAAEALFTGDRPPEVLRWTAEAAMVSVGPATTRILRTLGAARVLESATPGDRGIVDAVAAVAFDKQQGHSGD